MDPDDFTAVAEVLEAEPDGTFVRVTLDAGPASSSSSVKVRGLLLSVSQLVRISALDLSTGAYCQKYLL